jgi:hypothetical protein
MPWYWFLPLSVTKICDRYVFGTPMRNKEAAQDKHQEG